MSHLNDNCGPCWSQAPRKMLFEEGDPKFGAPLRHGACSPCTPLSGPKGGTEVEGGWRAREPGTGQGEGGRAEVGGPAGT